MRKDDKVSKFVAAITKEAQAKQETILKETEEFIEAEMKKAEDEALREAYHLIQRKGNEIKEQMGREFSVAQTEMKRSLFKRRQEIMDQVMLEAKEKIREFTKTEGYKVFLQQSCEKAATRFVGEQLTIFYRKDDEAYLELIKKALPWAKFEQDNTIVFGGLKYQGGSDRFMANDTLDERIFSQQQWFFGACGLNANVN